MLEWLPYDEEPRFGSFREEMVNNPASTVNEQQFDFYKLQCLAKMKGTKYKLDEMMALKLYSGTTIFQSLLQRAFWTQTLVETNKEFYRWAVKCIARILVK